MNDTTFIPQSITKWPPGLQVCKPINVVLTNAPREPYHAAPSESPQTILVRCCAIKLDFFFKASSWNKPGLFDLHLFDKIPSLVGTGPGGETECSGNC